MRPDGVYEVFRRSVQWFEVWHGGELILETRNATAALNALARARHT